MRTLAFWAGVTNWNKFKRLQYEKRRGPLWKKHNSNGVSELLCITSVLSQDGHYTRLPQHTAHRERKALLHYANATHWRCYCPNLSNTLTIVIFSSRNLSPPEYLQNPYQASNTGSFSSLILWERASLVRIPNPFISLSQIVKDSTSAHVNFRCKHFAKSYVIVNCWKLYQFGGIFPSFLRWYTVGRHLNSKSRNSNRD